jgi:transposase InsO family protein
VRFEADMPNECWQSDFTHYRLARRRGNEAQDTEILTFLDDHSRKVLHMSAHVRVTGEIVRAAFLETVARHGIPASTLTNPRLARFIGRRGSGIKLSLKALARARNCYPKLDRGELATPRRYRFIPSGHF